MGRIRLLDDRLCLPLLFGKVGIVGVRSVFRFCDADLIIDLLLCVV